MVVSFITEQGGVGKTSLCFNLAWYLASAGKKVLMIDLDPQGGNLSYFAGIKDLDDKPGIIDVLQGAETITNVQHILENGLFIIPANERAVDLAYTITNSEDKIESLKNAIAPIKRRFDYIFIDMNPTPSVIHLASLAASDSLIIPLLPDGKSIEGTTHVIDTYNLVKSTMNKKLKILGLVYNKYEKRTRLSKAVETTMEGYCNEHGVPIAATKIPVNVAIGETVLTKQGVTEYAPKSKGADSYQKLSKELFGI